MPTPEFLTANLMLSLSGARVRVEMTVPSAAVGLREILPACRSLTEAIIDQAEESEAAEGRQVSCRKGCGACCRQLVPISEVEARQIRDLVDQLPEPRRSHVRMRFAETRRRLDEAGLTAILDRREGLTTEELHAIGLQYFALGVACPFLEDESCSIHAERPIVCREFLVTSPASECAQPTPETVRGVPLPGKVSNALNRMAAQPDRPSPRASWVPLSLALDWAADHPDQLTPRPGPQWISELLEILTGQTVLSPPVPTAGSDRDE
jgi:Fe-S-cluster containining protein